MVSRMMGKGQTVTVRPPYRGVITDHYRESDQSDRNITANHYQPLPYMVPKDTALTATYPAAIPLIQNPMQTKWLNYLFCGPLFFCLGSGHPLWTLICRPDTTEVRP